jgi:hypothetical protein
VPLLNQITICTICIQFKSPVETLRRTKKTIAETKVSSRLIPFHRSRSS